MNVEEKLQECIHILELMCKPSIECTPSDLAELDQYIGADQMAYDTLDLIGVKPSWDRPSIDGTVIPHLRLITVRKQ